jgi:predicted RNase H-like HicB family nuclease
MNRNVSQNEDMRRPFAASVWREGDWYVARCLEIDVASQGETEEDALSGLTEALELHFEPLRATRPPLLRTIEVEVGAA